MNFAHQIRLEPTPAEVTRLNVWLDQLFADAHIQRSLAADLKLCLNEIVANLICYGLKDAAKPLIAIEVRLQPRCALARVTDNGVYFDIREWPLPKDRDLMAGELGGFGVGLIRERASRIDYKRVGEFNRLDITCEG